MRMTTLKVENYRGLQNVKIPLSAFGCLIGENNSGKSSILQALSLFRTGASLSSDNYYDTKKEIRIAVTFSDITQGDLDMLAEKHGCRIADIVSEGELTIVRRYGLDGKSKLRYEKMIPKDSKFADDKVEALVKGKNGADLIQDFLAVFPELQERVGKSLTQKAAKELVAELGDNLSDNEKVLGDAPLPTGIDTSIIPMLPEPIYIAAVKDLSDDTKVRESTPFGKILNMLLRSIEGELGDVEQLFQDLNRKLNRIKKEDGTIDDAYRLDEVKRIESLVEQYVQESFDGVKLEINVTPPDLKTVMSNAKILADDGVLDVIDNKGDGLRRTVVFAVIRTYVEMNSALLAGETENAADRPGQYIILYEEPELYLHPKAQQILFDTLSKFSKRHYVMVSTHSPAFFGPEATATFVKLSKRQDPAIGIKPFTYAHYVDLSDVSAKDQFQLICYENNNAAFFSDTVVLVEGDSDLILFPYIARLLNPEWDCARTSVALAKISGKSSIKRYKDFFSRFGVRVVVISDLDLLVKDFRQINPTDGLKTAHSQLLTEADRVINASGAIPEPTGDAIRRAHGSGELRALWSKAREVRASYQNGETTAEELETVVNEFFTWERHDARLTALANATGDLARMKHKLLADLRKHDVFILEKGAIEAYYPPEIAHSDKPTMAQQFCRLVTTREGLLRLCCDCPSDNGDEPQKEFEVILNRVFNRDGASALN